MHCLSLSRRLAVAATLLVAASPTWPCGLEDPNSLSLRRGALNLAYPNALYVGTATWQAQMTGLLPRDVADQREDLAPEARATLKLMHASWLVRRLGARLAASKGDGPRPALSVVTLDAVMWSRFTTRGDEMAIATHIAGPEAGDIVVVTDTPVIQALVDGALSFAQAIEFGVLRLYGQATEVGAAETWLTGLGNP